MEMKTCSRCDVEYPSTSEYFTTDKRLKCGLKAVCKECNKQYRKINKDKSKAYYDANKENILEQKKLYHKENFEAIMKTKKMRYEANKEKMLAWQKSYYEANKERIREYRTENAEQIAHVGKIRRIKKAKHIAEIQRVYIYKRRRQDNEFRILDACRKRIYKAITGNTRATHTKELIGCSVEYLKEYLEKQFIDGMTWDNYGQWHIDHIIPCASFDFSIPESQFECFNYKNLQPLWAEENFKKSDKLIGHY